MITTTLNTKVLGIENKIPDIPNLVTKSLLNIKATAVNVKYMALLINVQRLLSIQSYR